MYSYIIVFCKINKSAVKHNGYQTRREFGKPNPCQKFLFSKMQKKIVDDLKKNICKSDFVHQLQGTMYEHISSRTQSNEKS